MKKLLLLLLLPIVGNSQQACAQATFPTIQYIDVNNIKAAALVHGDMWWNPTTEADACEFPKNSGLNMMGASSLWIAGYDPSHTLHVAAATYRQSGNDYWPGILDANDTMTYATSQKWATIWKINATDIQSFLALPTHTVSNTPAAILTWPGAGNIYATGNNGDTLQMVPGRRYAPFVDVNNDGLYEPLQGEYPVMKGDQMLWWVYNDNGPTHNATLSPALKFEIQVCAYAYNRNTLIDNVVYYQYTIINRSAITYDSVRIGQFSDMNLGDPYNDFVGYDSTFRMAFAYNGTANDSLSATDSTSYGTQIPIAGITMIHLPDDSAGKPEKVKSFITYKNDLSPNGNPTNGIQYNEYLRGRLLDGTPPNQSYYLTDPLAECDSSHTPSDRHIVMATDDMTFIPGVPKSITIALVATNRDTGHACPDITLADLTTVADTAWAIYSNPLPPAGVQNINVAQSSSVTVYPNPVNDVLQVKYSNLQNGNIVITDITGRIIISTQLSANAGTQQINIHNAAAGMYIYRITDGNGSIAAQGKITKL